MHLLLEKYPVGCLNFSFLGLKYGQTVRYVCCVATPLTYSTLFLIAALSTQ